MRKIFAFLVVALMLPSSAKAQYKLEYLVASSGSDPISSGVAGTARFAEPGGKFAEVSLQSEQGWLVFGKYLRGERTTLALGATLGHLQSAPWVGPLIDLDYRIGEGASVGFIFWPGFFFEEPNDWKTGNDGVANPESILAGKFGGVRWRVGGFQLSYHLLNFLDEPTNQLPGVSYTFSVRDGISLTASATLNKNSDDLMPWIGMTWIPG